MSLFGESLCAVHVLLRVSTTCVCRHVHVYIPLVTRAYVVLSKSNSYGVCIESLSRRFGLSGYRCLAAGIRQRTTACERCSEAAYPT